jgi:hypothetical protein
LTPVLFSLDGDGVGRRCRTQFYRRATILGMEKRGTRQKTEEREER